MEVTALCVTLLMNVLLLLSAHHQEVESAVLRVEPNRLQFFEYEPVTLHCEGPTGEKLLCNSTSRAKGSSCAIKNAFADDSGDYRCEDRGGRRRSNIVTITVTAGSVILESPALPVREEDAVTLRCRNKTTTLAAEFFKDGRSIGSSSTGTMTISSVSKSDEGLYRCRVSGAGESPESRLAVTGHHEETTPTSSSSTPWIVMTLLLLLLLMVVGALHLSKRHWNRVLDNLRALTLRSSSAVDRTASVETGAAGGDTEVYATVTKNRRKKDDDALVSTPIYYTFDLDDTQQLAGPGVSSPAPSAGTNTPVTSSAFYSTVQWPAG